MTIRNSIWLVCLYKPSIREPDAWYFYSDSIMAAEFVSVEADTRETLGYLRGFAEFHQVRLFVTGELAVWRYFPDHQVKEVCLFVLSLNKKVK